MPGDDRLFDAKTVEQRHHFAREVVDSIQAGAAAAVALGCCAALWGGLVVAMPDRLGVSLLGDSWAAARELAVPLTVFVTASAALVPATAGLRAVVAMRRILFTSLLAPLSVPFAAAGVWLGGTAGGAAGLAAANCLMAAVFWWQFAAAIRSGAANDVTPAPSVGKPYAHSPE
ncbi:MAG: hypothetical protein ACRD2W_15945 [Acidimicrobiales bacterium]